VDDQEKREFYAKYRMKKKNKKIKKLTIKVRSNEKNKVNQK
jgi:hypothetical protein